MEEDYYALYRILPWMEVGILSSSRSVSESYQLFFDLFLKAEYSSGSQ